MLLSAESRKHARRVARETKRPQGGSVWILAPAAVLVLVILAAIAVDSAIVFLGQRQLANAAASAATDAAGAISRSTFYTSGSGQIVIDPVRASQLAQQSLAAQNLTSVHIISAATQVLVSGSQVCVSLAGKVQPIFGKAIPGSPISTTVHATSVATAAGLNGTSVPTSQICQFAG